MDVQKEVGGKCNSLSNEYVVCSSVLVVAGMTAKTLIALSAAASRCTDACTVLESGSKSGKGKKEGRKNINIEGVYRVGVWGCMHLHRCIDAHVNNTPMFLLHGGC